MDDIRVKGPRKKVAKRPAKLNLERIAAHPVSSKKKPVPKSRVVAAKKPVVRLKKKRSLRYRVKFWWKLSHRRYGWRWRAANGLVAALIVFSVVTPVILHLLNNRGYQLSAATLDLVGKTDPKLTSKLTYDATTKTYQFNKESIKEFNPADQLKAQVGTPQQDEQDKALYSLDVPQDPKQGVTYYDTNSQLSFKLIPQFGARAGKLQQQRLVYPLGNNTQAVYTLKNNGLKEDIVVQKATEDSMRFSYTLQLPKTLAAKPLEDGSGAIGIYSGNPTLFQNMSYGSDKDRELVEKARENSDKDTLVFGIPAPIITTSKSDDATKTKARFQLEGSTLTVIAEGLTNLKQPFSIDPSVVITSATDFETGNNEGNISFATAGSAARGTLTGGTVAAWSTDATDTVPTTSNYTKTVFYNGYYYLFNYSNTGTRTLYYAAVQSGGDIGPWTQTTDLPNALANHNIGVAAYNGYLYITSSGTTAINAGTHYIKINANGSLAASWTPGSNLNTARGGANATAHNGRLYVVSGCTAINLGICTSQTKTTEYATINPDGSPSSWTTTSTLTNNHTNSGIAAYNGYLYAIGGADNDAGGRSIEYAPINSDGSLGTWVVNSNSLITQCQVGVGIIANGYIYYGPCSYQTGTNTTQYAPINANGSIGPVANTSTLPANSSGVAMATDGKGHIVVLGGGTSSNATYYTTINPAGVTRPWATTNDFDTANRHSMPSVATQGYLYLLGGSSDTNAVRYAPFNADGTVGTWQAGNTFTTGRVGSRAVAYGDSIYIAGGARNGNSGNCNNVCTDVQRATVNPTTGQLTWTNTYIFNATGRTTAGVTINNGYLYVIGGSTTSNGGSPVTTVDYAAINADGTLGSFSSTTAGLGTARVYVGAYAWNGKIYVIGGSTATSEYATPVSDGNITSWAATGNNLPQAYQGAEVAGNKGYIYVAGGVYGSGSYSNETHIAKINADGTLGNWSTSPNLFTTARAHAPLVAHNDFLYLSGGCNNTALCLNQYKDVQYARINNGGSGANGGWANVLGGGGGGSTWNGTAAYGNYVYSVGGCGGTPALGGRLSCGDLHNLVIRAPICDGTMSGSGCNSGTANNLGNNINNDPTISGGRFGLTSVAYNGYIYAIGGCTAVNSSALNTVCTTFASDVQYASIGSNGALGSWASAGGSFGTPRYGHASGVNNGYLYVFGGCSAATVGSGGCTTFTNEVSYALICTGGNNGIDGCGATPGQLGTWHNSTTPTGFTNRMYFGGVVYNGYLYALGGCAALSGSSCSTFTNSVQRLQLNSDGSLNGNWISDRSINGARFGIGAVAYNGYIYVSGGCASTNTNMCSDASSLDTVDFAAIGSGGALGSWQTSADKMTAKAVGHGMVVGAGNLVSIRGSTDNGSYSQTEYIAPLTTIPRKSLYSKLLTFSYSISPRLISYNGTLANGTLDVTYKGSSSGTSWTGSVTNGSSLTNARCPSPASNRYLQLMVTLDDTQRATYPDESTNAANLTDLTLSYEFARPPNMRLKLGKILQENIGQSDLDICKLPSQ